MALSPRAWGAAAAVLGIVVDQAYKWWMLGPFDIASKGRIAVAPFADLVLVWNRGVSYGFLTQDAAGGQWFLIALGLVGAAVFAWWLKNTGRLLPAVALGLVIGGALSNVIDRLLYGAVADFFLLHAGGFEWYVFNLADVWISAGVVGLAIAWLTERRENATDA
ncbi:signal peptidase II [Propylenella binzhouense]|uniref:Lipoprotein signal peptidase n=1 Tax=Propylenella binzhouense TaxID=2555902 RepID=A0A964WS27_9HYPH|nr:signal peptidase II [Propylenella binzhouense]MYZ46522.1 signal peptidase II [Propylenella binzhouense]